MIKYLFSASIMLLTISCGSNAENNSEARKLPYYNTADFTPNFEKTVPDNFHQIRPFSLTAHTGQPFTEKNMEKYALPISFLQVAREFVRG
ncbi:hypothetical protein L0657_15740 [Dyadobacter sp. CY345]|uniref:hypothetical protein n=1 Tax=Dyadobacter sp. CY345 TaxID=2909335 RepID=UPI001F1C5E72|nr:hypothetical protein [Dyadobacter sp. CY345]MCF2445414.1 hypothetical protein [Dyadobacter sp. CY345]